MNSEAQDQSIESLLIELFEPDEFRRFVEKLDCGASIVAELPGPQTSRATLVHEATKLLRRRGDLGAGFFEALQRERPGQRASILATAQRLLSQNGSSETLRVWHEPRETSSAARTKWFFLPMLVVGVMLSLVATVVTWRLATATESSPCVDIHACTVKCEGCQGLTRGWITLENGETYTVPVEGNAIRFTCLREGTKFAVVLEIRDGRAQLKYFSKSMVAESGTVEIPLNDFSSGVPPGFSPNQPLKNIPVMTRGSRLKSPGINETETAEVRGLPPIDHTEAIDVNEDLLLAEEESEKASAVESLLVPFVPSTATVQPVQTQPDTKVWIKPKRSSSIKLPRKPDINCERNRKLTLEAHNRWAWKMVIRLTEGHCWANDPQGLALRVHAMKEHGDFKGCITQGDSSHDEKIMQLVKFCRDRLRWQRDHGITGSESEPDSDDNTQESSDSPEL